MRSFRALSAVLTIGGMVFILPHIHAASPIAYRFTFPEPEHHWMQVEATFTELGPDPLELRMSRSSPGRYSLHDFAKNVYDVQVAGGGLDARPDPYGWNVKNPRGAV